MRGSWQGMLSSGSSTVASEPVHAGLECWTVHRSNKLGVKNTNSGNYVRWEGSSLHILVRQGIAWQGTRRPQHTR